ncbi:MAG: hypothetical protein ACRYGL_01060 [Janthinobacterium lividum]
MQSRFASGGLQPPGDDIRRTGRMRRAVLGGYRRLGAPFLDAFRVALDPGVRQRRVRRIDAGMVDEPVPGMRDVLRPDRLTGMARLKKREGEIPTPVPHLVASLREPQAGQRRILQSGQLGGQCGFATSGVRGAVFRAGGRVFGISATRGRGRRTCRRWRSGAGRRANESSAKAFKHERTLHADDGGTIPAGSVDYMKDAQNASVASGHDRVRVVAKQVVGRG